MATNPIQREGLIYDNPEKFYDFGDKIGAGKKSVVRAVKCKVSGNDYAAKMIYCPDDDTMKYALREYDFMASSNLRHRGLVELHQAYMVRKYVILIMELVDGKTLLDQFSHRQTITEDDVAVVIKQLCEVLDFLHKQDIGHFDIRPTNIRFVGKDIKLLDYDKCRQLAEKEVSEVSESEVFDLGGAEFLAPEILLRERLITISDMWSVSVITAIMLGGDSPYYKTDSFKTRTAIHTFTFERDFFTQISEEAKDFINIGFKSNPVMRMTAEQALKHPWLSDANQAKRQQISLTFIQDAMKKTDARIIGDEEEEYIDAPFVLRTFEEEEYEESSDW